MNRAGTRFWVQFAIPARNKAERIDNASTLQELQELYSPLEEAKADIVGLWALHYLLDKVRRERVAWQAEETFYRRMSSGFSYAYIVVNAGLQRLLHRGPSDASGRQFL